MKKILVFIAVAVAALTMSSCQKWLDVNKNVDAPDYIDEFLYLPGILAENQYYYYDNRALCPIAKMFGTSTSWSNYAQQYFYSISSDNGGGFWYVTYFHHGMNLENMINQAIEKGEWTLAGIGMTIKAYDWDKLTKECGELPCKQAYEPGRTVFDYDYQEDIYPIVRGWANKAIEYLEKEDNVTPQNTLAKQDYAYGGDKAKWLKLAHSIIVSQLASLTNKNDFLEKYADTLLYHAQYAMTENADNYITRTLGGGVDALYTNYNNFWGVTRGNISYTTAPHEWATAIMTGTVPYYDEAGKLINVYALDKENPEHAGTTWYQYKLAEKQYCADTLVFDADGKRNGHFDPRPVCKIGSRTTDFMYFINIDQPDSIVKWQFQGAKNTNYTGTNGNNAGSLYGGLRTGYTVNALRYGKGKWLYRDDAPYILMTAAEIAFDVAETYWKKGDKNKAYEYFVKGVELDEEFTESYINEGKPATSSNGVGETVGTYVYERPMPDGSKQKYWIGGSVPGGCPITKTAYRTLADEYINGPYVKGLGADNLTISHIMLQKFIALYPWGAIEAWTDQRKYFYDIKYTGEYPKDGNGWDDQHMYHKDENDPTRVFKGYYLPSADVDGCRTRLNTTYNTKGSPCFRIRPRYNSEYMWNKPALKSLVPISGYSTFYHQSIPWFAYPGDQPKELWPGYESNM